MVKVARWLEAGDETITPALHKESNIFSMSNTTESIPITSFSTPEFSIDIAAQEEAQRKGRKRSRYPSPSLVSTVDSHPRRFTALSYIGPALS